MTSAAEAVGTRVAHGGAGGASALTARVHLMDGASLGDAVRDRLARLETMDGVEYTVEDVPQGGCLRFEFDDSHLYGIRIRALLADIASELSDVGTVRLEDAVQAGGDRRTVLMEVVLHEFAHGSPSVGGPGVAAPCGPSSEPIVRETSGGSPSGSPDASIDATPPEPFCSAHPGGTFEKCDDCARARRNRWEWIGDHPVTLDSNQTVWQRTRGRLAEHLGCVIDGHELDELATWMLPYVSAERVDAAEKVGHVHATLTRSDVRLIRGVVRDVVREVRSFEFIHAAHSSDRPLEQRLIELASRVKVERHVRVRRDQDDEGPGITLAHREGLDASSVNDGSAKCEHPNSVHGIGADRQVVDSDRAALHGSPSVAGPDVPASVLASEPIVGEASGVQSPCAPDAASGGVA